jgi:hypothetical protein
LSRHLGSKEIEEDRGYGHYTIFGLAAAAPPSSDMNSRRFIFAVIR